MQKRETTQLSEGGSEMALIFNLMTGIYMNDRLILGPSGYSRFLVLAGEWFISFVDD